ncbi:MAG: DUF1800 domain-containing protein [Thaumarchaeota archaeon]|nr:DUF1800 domain-containing protein [Nitrososphaerota archaeon]
MGAGVTAATVYSLDVLKLVNLSSLLEPSQVQGTSISSDTQVPHLLRRAGFGASQSELSSHESLGFNSAVDKLVNYESVDNSPLDSTQPNILLEYSGKRTGGELNNLATWWLNRMVKTNRPLEEKMTLFWHNHFATGYSKVQNGYLMYKQNEFFRTNALGNFKDILSGITADGAMLVWLDGNQNRKGNPNENFAREVMEVFSTGRGPYTEDDVKAGALAFTGYKIDTNGNGVFDPNLHDGSVKTFLGHTGNFGPADIIDILVSHPSTAANLSNELFSFFAYPSPSPDTVKNLSQVYLDSGHSIKALVQAILTSPEFMSSQAYMSQIKSPAEFVAGSLRSLGATADPVKSVTSMSHMGQMLFDPPSVFGWPSGLGWIDTASVLERYNFPLLLQTSQENPSSNLAPAAFGGSTPDSAAIDQLIRPLHSEGLPTEFMHVIESSTASLSDPVQKTKNAVRLAMASPFYNIN